MIQDRKLSGKLVDVKFSIYAPGYGMRGYPKDRKELDILVNSTENVKCAYIKTDQNISKNVYVSNIFRVFDK